MQARRTARLTMMGTQAHRARPAPIPNEPRRHAAPLRLEDLQSDWQNRPTVKRDMRIVALY